MKVGETLERKLRGRAARLAVVGLGYVGLPLAMEMVGSGFEVTGIDIDEERVGTLRAGRSYIQDTADATVKTAFASGRFSPTRDFDYLAAADAVIICVPTPLRKTRDPDVSYIKAATKEVRRTLHGGQLVVLESTTYPGTTEEMLRPTLEATGLKVGEDFFLAFSPERVDPGNKEFTIRNTPKVVGGVTPQCARLAATMYRQFVESVVTVSCPRTAEMVKLLENTFRNVNIALANEIAIMCEPLGVDVHEVISAAATKPFGFTPFYPGPGLGGHCIPVDPHYLAWKLRGLGLSSRFIDLATEINQQMPRVVVGKVTDALNTAGKSMNGARILILGASYKRDVGDVRESPALTVLALLDERGAMLSYHDPYLPFIEFAGKTLQSVPLSAKCIAKQDAVVLVTDHGSFDLPLIAANAQLLVDTRGATRGLKDHPTNIFRIGAASPPNGRPACSNSLRLAKHCRAL